MLWSCCQYWLEAQNTRDSCFKILIIHAVTACRQICFQECTSMYIPGMYIDVDQRSRVDSPIDKVFNRGSINSNFITVSISIGNQSALLARHNLNITSEEVFKSSHNSFLQFHFSVCWGYLMQHEPFMRKYLNFIPLWEWIWRHSVSLPQSFYSHKFFPWTENITRV